MTEIWVVLIVFIVSLVIARSSKPTWCRATATVIASLIGGVGILALVIFWGGLLSSDSSLGCDNKSGGIYENKGKLCYNENEFSTLENKVNGKVTSVVKFTVLDKGKAIIHTNDDNDYIILDENDGIEVYPYEAYELANQPNEDDSNNSIVANKINCHDFYMNDKYDGFTFPSTGSSVVRPYDVNGLVCYQGRDITSWVAGEGMKVTTAIIPNPKESLAIVTVEEEHPETFESKSSIRVIYVTQNGLRGKKDIIRQRYTKDPKTTLSDMKIVGYNYEKGIVYFSVPAWAVSNAIHAFTIPFDNNYSNIREKFITDGDLTFVNMSNLLGKPEYNKYIGSLIVEQSAIKEGEGRVYGQYLVSPEGKEVCELNTEVDTWRVYLPCKE
ncbi:hypothetical protein [Photorhabdus sp. SF281]|uniref:hypothetical protein n=1 Tax=Photorhabdus sp. SF281 TaxID=3459527 RepID=UPI00404472F1